MKIQLDFLAQNSDAAALQDRKATYHDREAAHYARLLREGRTEEGRRPLDLEVERLTLEAETQRFSQKYEAIYSEMVAWHGRMATYYDREAAHWARLWREGRTDQGPRPADLEAERRFVEAEMKNFHEILDRLPPFVYR